MNEYALIEKLRRRDADALFFLYNEYRDRVFAVVRRIVRDEWDAEEVVQDVFWTVHRKIDLFREDSALWSWMYRIAVNAAKMKVHKYKRFPIPMEDDILHDMHSREEGSDDPIPSPDEKLISKELIAQMNAYLNEVSELNRQLYVEMEAVFSNICLKTEFRKEYDDRKGPRVHSGGTTARRASDPAQP